MSFGSNRISALAAAYLSSEDRLSLGLNQPQSIADNLVMASPEQIASGGMISRQEGQASSIIGSRRSVSRSARRMTPFERSPAATSSVAIAKWLAIGPKILILDAPTVGVDAGARAGSFEIVRKIGGAGTGDHSDLGRTTREGAVLAKEKVLTHM